MRPKVFIASSFEQLNVARTLQENLEGDAEATVWDQGVIEPSQMALEGLLEAVNTADFAVFVFAADDQVLIRSDLKGAPRDNVIFESGMFIGALGRERNFFVVPAGRETLRLPSDLLGLAVIPYDASRTNLQAGLGPACNQLRRLFAKHGVRQSRRTDLVQTQRDVYVYAFNRLNPYSDISLTQNFLRNLPGRRFEKIDDVLYPLDSLIHHYVPHLVDETMRVYFAYRLPSPLTTSNRDDPETKILAHYRFGISHSASHSKWYEGLCVGIPSNIHRAYSRNGVSKVHNARDHANTLAAQNQRVRDEGSVIAVPVQYGDDEGHSECIGIVGISSPQEGAATRPETEALAHELGVVFSALFYAYGRYLQRTMKFDAVTDELRRQIADHFESKFND